MSTETENINTETQSEVKTEAETNDNTASPLTRSVVKIVIGLGLVGLILWLSPYTLGDIFGMLALPMLIFVIVAGLVMGTGMVGKGSFDALSSTAFWADVQTRLRARVAALKAQAE